jgi:hypothetical protein
MKAFIRAICWRVTASINTATISARFFLLKIDKNLHNLCDSPLHFVLKDIIDTCYKVYKVLIPTFSCAAALILSVFIKACEYGSDGTIIIFSIFFDYRIGV